MVAVMRCPLIGDVPAKLFKLDELFFCAAPKEMSADDFLLCAHSIASCFTGLGFSMKKSGWRRASVMRRTAMSK